MGRGVVGENGHHVLSRVETELNRDPECVTSQLLTMEVWTVQTAALRTGLVQKRRVLVMIDMWSCVLTLFLLDDHCYSLQNIIEIRFSKLLSECSQLEHLANVIWTCSNDSENINCTIACADGYDFDHEIKPYYLCGLDTFYLWDFQTDDNPSGKLPTCQSKCRLWDKLMSDSISYSLLLFIFRLLAHLN